VAAELGNRADAAVGQAVSLQQKADSCGGCVPANRAIHARNFKARKRIRGEKRSATFRRATDRRRMADETWDDLPKEQPRWA
jgi:hypothetical protein